MKKQSSIQFLLFLFLIPCTLSAQDITGLWKGSIYNDTTQKVLYYEIAISESNGKYSGYSYTIFDVDSKKEIGVKKIGVKKNKDEIIIEDLDLISNTYSAPPPKGIRQLSKLILSEDDSTLVLEGKWKTNRTKKYSPVTGSLQVKRMKSFIQSPLVAKLQDMNKVSELSFVDKNDMAVVKTLPPPVKVQKEQQPDPIVAKVKKQKKEVPKREKVVRQPINKDSVATIAKIDTKTPSIAAAEIKNRTTKNARTVFFESDSLIITLYDNGEVDGDTVSILLNGDVIIPKQGLSSKAYNKTIYFDRNSPDSLLLEMYAENLGSIPPNSGLLIVRDGTKNYEVFFAADLKTNAAIQLLRKKPEDK